MEETKLLCSDASVDANYTNFGCIGCSAYIRKDSGHNNSSTTISDIVHCNVGDHIAVRLTQEAATGLVTAPTGGTSVALSTRRTEAFATRPFVADPMVAHVPEAAAPVTFDLEGIVGSAVRLLNAAHQGLCSNVRTEILC